MLRQLTIVVALFVVLCFAFQGPARATLITVNIDASRSGRTTYSGLAAAPDLGTFWNRFTGSSLTNLTASDGTTTTTVGFAAASPGFSFGSTTAAPPYNNLLDDYGQRWTTTVNTTLSGLTPGMLYDLYIYASSTEFVGEFWLGEVAKCVKQRDFDGFVHPKAIRFSHGQFALVV
ncbi:MAG: hypothetical protein KKA28_16700 [Planctomycetes bacterium]|nr:hypothetical protein [Planctomycetota bacterium]